jgi:hypothetical protein
MMATNRKPSNSGMYLLSLWGLLIQRSTSFILARSAFVVVFTTGWKIVFIVFDLQCKCTCTPNCIQNSSVRGEEETASGKFRRFLVNEQVFDLLQLQLPFIGSF